MIPVQPMPEPKDFDAKVRHKGKQVLAKHKPVAPVPATFWKARDHWRGAIDDLYEGYGRVCAFTAMRIERVTGSPTVEHFKPKSRHPQLAYEWSNLRLICGRMNGRKGNSEDVLDPCQLAGRIFDINFVTGRIRVHRDCPSKLRTQAQLTLDRLKLHDHLCNRARFEHAEKVLRGDWSAAEAETQSPFVYLCLREQGLI